MNHIGQMDWKACKKCKNQAGPKGCNVDVYFGDMIELNEETDEIICAYFLEAGIEHLEYSPLQKEKEMATMQLSLSYISEVKQDPHNIGCIIVDCNMNLKGQQDTIAQICEQMGGDAFMDYVKIIMT